MAEPRRNQLRRLLERPDAAPRVRSAVSRLLGVTVLSIGVIGALAIWHLVRRGRLIRDRLGTPRSVRPLTSTETFPDDDPAGQLPPS